MTVKIIADSLGDIPANIVKDLDITIIPIQVLFGTTGFRDGVDLTTEQFYSKLVSSKTLPTSAVPALGSFVEAYDKVSERADEIIVLTISHKLSGTYETACRAVELARKRARIKVIDTLQVIMAEGLITIEAARAAKAKVSMDEIVKQIERNIKRAEPRMAFDTLEYLKRGGRIGAAQAFVLGFKKIDAIGVEDATTPAEADALADRLKEKFPNTPMYRSKVSAVIGVHVGPSVIAVSVLGDRRD